MAFMIPEAIPARAGAPTAGERKVFVALRDHLPEDYLVYYDIPVRGRHPDFIVIGPDLGLVVLEVKDWKLGAIQQVTPEGVTLRSAEGDIQQRNPIQQAREYVFRAVDALKSCPRLSDGGRLRFGWGYGAVFPLLRKRDVTTPALFGPTLEEALGREQVLTADDLTAESLLQRLRHLLPQRAARQGPLTADEIDEIRGVLYPEIRIGWGSSGDEIVRVMDLEQERLARTLGEGHRVLRGVAGSGKTVVLIGRARYLRERYPDWRILALCYNRILAEYLREVIGAGSALEVLHFHRWCFRQLEGAKVEVPKEPSGEGDRSKYWERDIPRLLLSAYERGRLQPAYHAILIDEGQDFADDWYRVVLRALDPETNSLFIAVDSSQRIYRRSVTWKEVGVQATGRTRVLSINYRNTVEILTPAYGLIEELDSTQMRAREAEQEYVVPKRALRNGPHPEICRGKSAEASRREALGWLRARLVRGTPPEEILLLVPNRGDMGRLETWLTDWGIPVRPLGRGEQSRSVRLSTIHSAKGLDAECVLLLNGQQLPRRDDMEARRLLYIAMTRARREFAVFYHGDSALMSDLARLVPGAPGR